MSEITTFPLPSGADFVIPDVGDENWGQSVTDFLLAIPLGVPPTSGTFNLTGDLYFGGTFGLISQYYKSAVVNPADAGLLRMAKTDSIGWRNNLNNGNLLLAIDGSNKLTFDGSPITIGGVTSITGTAHQVIASASTGAVTLSTPQNIDTTSSPTFSTLTLGAGMLTIGTASQNGSLILEDGSAHALTITQGVMSGSYSMSLPTAQGAADTFISNDGSGNTSWVKPVVSITGTANEIIASSSNGAVTLSTPQAIGTTSSPTFASLTLTGNLNTALNTNIGGSNSWSLFSSGILHISGVPNVQFGSDIKLNDFSLVFRDSGTKTLTISPPTSYTNTYTLVLPLDQASGTQFLQNNGSGTLSWATPAGGGTVNSGTSTHLAYYATSTTAVSDANGATISGNYTFSGIPTFQNTVAITTGHVLEFFNSGDTFSANVSAPTLTGNRNVTIPDPGTNANFVLSEGVATINGVKTFAAGAGAITMSSSTIAMGANKITGLANGTASTDAAAFGQIKYLTAPAQTVSTTNFNSTSSTYATTNLSASITPSSASSRIKITVTATAQIGAVTGVNCFISIFRGSTNLATGGNAAFNRIKSTLAQALEENISMVFIDSPSTTSSTTYAVKIKNSDNTTSIDFGNADDQVMILEEIV